MRNGKWFAVLAAVGVCGTALLMAIPSVTSTPQEASTEGNPTPVAPPTAGPKQEETTMESSSQRETATLAGGCFWCLEAVFEQVIGVEKVVSGYANGHLPDPTYQQVCDGVTGHAEVVQVIFDPSVVSYADLLNIFFTIHDPTTLNRQGADVGTQYRSAILTNNDAQAATANARIAELNAEQIWPRPIVTQVEPLDKFYPAEEYHQGYYRTNPGQGYCRAVISPKVAKFRSKFADKMRK